MLLGGYAIKIPNFLNGWRMFLLGLIGNQQEYHFNKIKDKRVCPVIFYICGGFLSVMPRCREVTTEEFLMINTYYFHPIDNEVMKTDDYMYCSGFNIPTEIKQDSFGWYKNRIVSFDYGS